MPSVKMRRTSALSARAKSRIRTCSRFASFRSNASAGGHICAEETIRESFLLPAMASGSSATILVSQTILGDEQCMQVASGNSTGGEIKQEEKKPESRWRMRGVGLGLSLLGCGRERKDRTGSDPARRTALSLCSRTAQQRRRRSRALYSRMCRRIQVPGWAWPPLSADWAQTPRRSSGLVDVQKKSLSMRERSHTRVCLG